LASDQAGFLEGDDHLVDGGWADAEVALHIGFGGRSPEHARRVVATARSIKPSSDADVLVVRGDIADRKAAERAIFEGMARFERIDTLVNNAGIFIAKPLVPRPTTRRSWASISQDSFTSRNLPSPRWRSRAAAMSCR
jgi:NAD(P)-dependent dehydrogenase (short-subunit alcohol dehydrogenase family)